MFTELKKNLIIILFSVSFGACTLADDSDSVMNEEMISAVVIGSAESPDPILKKVQDLEKNGILKDVIVMESFPVQIRMTGPKRVIDQLNAMPRKKLPSSN